MNLKKIIASVAAAAVAVTTMAISSFAISLDSSYVGDWNSSASIPKSEFDAFSGDVKVVLTVEANNKGEACLIKPIDVDKSWDAITSSLRNTEDSKNVAKPDGFMQIKYDQTTVEFVVPSAVAKDFWNNGLAFQVYNVTVKSATLSDGVAGTAFTEVGENDTLAYCAGTFDPFAATETTPAETEAAPAETEAAPAEETKDEAPAETEAEVLDDVAEDVVEDVIEDDAAPVVDTVEEASAPAETTAAADETAAAAVETPAADSTTTAAKTGNTAAAVVVSVMAVAAAAAVVSKRK